MIAAMARLPRRKSPAHWVRDPIGGLVVLADEVWREHVVRRHEDMEGLRGKVLACIREPDFIFRSNRQEDRYLYFKRLDEGRWIEVVVAESGEGRVVVTAHLTRRLPKGREPLYAVEF